MERVTSKWRDDVRRAMIEKKISYQGLADMVGCCKATVTSVINGRHSNTNKQMYAEKINEILGTEGVPERIGTPSDEWCMEVKVELVKQRKSIKALSEELGVSRDTLSLVINGKLMNEDLVESINANLGISIPAVPNSDNKIIAEG